MIYLQLEVDLDNHNAITFYTKNGFAFSDAKSETSVKMIKSL